MPITTNIKHYPSAHGKGEGGGGGTTIIMGGNGSDIPANLNVTSINAAQGDITSLSGKNITYNNGNFIYMGAKDGTVTKIRGDQLHYAWGKIDDFEADKIKAGRVEADEISAVKGWIDYLNSKQITTEYLTVTKQAHFFELVIDKIKSVGGSIILTPANCIADYVKAYASNGDEVPLVDANGTPLDNIDTSTIDHYDVWFREDDGSGRKMTNDWQANDQAICQSFNNVSTGVNYNVSNKYYWRLVTDKLTDQYMNLNTGATLPLSSSAQASVNSVRIYNPTISFVDNLNNNVNMTTGWTTEAQHIDGVVTGAAWTQTTGGAGNNTDGTMTTTNVIFGIQMYPEADNLDLAIPQSFSLQCSKARLNIGFYYTDGTSQFFPAPATGQTFYSYNLTTEFPIETIVITNADEVEWHLVHGIRLSNTDCDNMLNGFVSIPSAGDNIVQLGYRPTGSDDPDKNRGNAIIISAYNKYLDQGTGVSGALNQYPLEPPFYAQYELIASNANHRFNLAYYRKTYMDANGSKFIGDFYAGGSLQNLEDMIDSGAADLYQLFVAYSTTDITEQAPSSPDGTTWSKTTVPGVSWPYMGFSSQPIILQTSETVDDAIARVEASLVFDDYDWTAIPGGTGTPGGHWENAYKNTSDKLNAPTPPNESGVPKTISELPYDKWYATPQTLADGEYTWMTQAFVNGSGTYSLWQTAIRLTGADGTDGTDGNDIEFIYTQNNGDNQGDPLTPSAPPPGAGPQGGAYPNDWPGHFVGPQGNQQYVDNDTVNGVQWYDNPQGVQENMQYEYVSQRLKKNGQWGDYTPPSLWSNWGRKGRDGDGYEYIYKSFGGSQAPTITGPQNPANWGIQSSDEYYGPDSGGQGVGNNWWDDPQGVNENKQWEYVSTRKKTNGQWGTYSEPALWAQWVPQGTQGQPGAFTEFAYRNFAENATTDYIAQNMPTNGYPVSDTQYMNGWTGNATTPAAGYYTWCISRTNTYNANYTINYGDWQTAYRITGTNGEDGADGADFEFIYTRDNGQQGPNGTRIPSVIAAPVYEWKNSGNHQGDPISSYDDWPNGRQGKDSNGVTWTDNPQGVQADLQFEYMVQRKMPRGPQGTQTWQPYYPDPAAVWSKWGANGRDGDGYEYIYKVFPGDVEPTITGQQNPATWGVQNSDEYYGPSGSGQQGYKNNWWDDPQGVDSTNRWEFVSTRKKTNGQWGVYSEPALWSQWVPAGTQGPQGDVGPQGNNGLNGSYTQNCYKAGGAQSILPAHPTNINGNQSSLPEFYLSEGWKDWPNEVTLASNQYLYCSDREVAYNASNDKVYGPWHDAYRMSGLPGPQGGRGADGDPGAPGANGTYDEFIYHLDTDLRTFSGVQNPKNWDSSTARDPKGHQFSDPDYTGPGAQGWTDDASGIDEVNRVEYFSQRHFDGTQFGKFTDPKVWSRWGEDGRDSDVIEYIYCLTANSTVIPNIYQIVSGSYIYNQQGGRVSLNPNLYESKYFDEYEKTYVTKWRHLSGAAWNDYTEYDYVPFSGVDGGGGPITIWQPNPQSVDATTYKCCWESRRRWNGETNEWGPFSDPAIWKVWPESGPQGAQGPQGASGDGADLYLLQNVGSSVLTGMAIDNNDNTIKSGVAISIKYNVVHIVNGEAHVLTANELNLNNIRAWVKVYKPLTESSTNFNYRYWKTSVDSNGTLIYSYNYDGTDSTVLANNSVIDVQLLNYYTTNNYINTDNSALQSSYDSDTIVSQMNEDTLVHIIDGQQGSIRTLSTGQQELANGLQGVQTGYSTLYEDYQNISGEVASLTTGVQGLTQEVAQIGIQADNITSTVTQNHYDYVASGDGNNLFGFNRGVLPYTDYIKLSPELYGFISWGNSSYHVYKLGIKKGGRYVVAFDIMNQNHYIVRPQLCTSNPIEVYDANGVKQTGNEITTTSEYKRWYCVYTISDSNAYITGSNSGTFKMHSTNGYSESYPIYVRNLHIIKDDHAIRPEFTHAIEDIEYAGMNGVPYTYTENNVEKRGDWIIDTNHCEAGDKYRGFTAYDNIVSLSSGDNYHLITTKNLTLKDKTPYTISFWAKSNTNGAKITTCLYRAQSGSSDIRLHSSTGAWNSNAGLSDGGGEDAYGTYALALTTEWKHYVLHYFTHRTSYNSISDSYKVTTQYGTTPIYPVVALPFRLDYNMIGDIKTAKVYVAGITFQEGWVEQINSTNQSFIKQTSDQISLGVQSYVTDASDDIRNQLSWTGIDITNGKILLNSENTEITGNLKITNPNEGLIIYDGTAPKISILKKTIGDDPTAFNSINEVEYHDYVDVAAGVSSWNFSSKSPKITIGSSFPSGSTITLSDFTWKAEGFTSNGNGWFQIGGTKHGIATNTLSWSVTGGTTAPTGSISTQGTINGLNNTSVTVGNSTIYLNFTTLSGTLESTGINATRRVWVTIKGKVSYRPSSGVIIGTDGITVQGTTGNYYTWIDSNSFIVKNNTNTLKIDGGYLQRCDSNGKFGDLSSVMPFKKVTSTSYFATLYDCFILVQYPSSSTVNIYLPKPSDAPNGKIYYVKSRKYSYSPLSEGANVNVNVSNANGGYYFIKQNNSDAAIQIECNKISYMFINTGEHWVTYYCG